MIKVLFVCLGNICRSPTAEGVFRKLAQEEGLADWIHIDSAGTHAYHVSEPPDLRAREAASLRGVDLSAIRARRLERSDFETFDHILVMDESNYRNLIAVCPPKASHKIKFFLDYAPHLGTREVPDPYYGGEYGFERVLDMIEDAAQGLLEQLKSERARR